MLYIQSNNKEKIYCIQVSGAVHTRMEVCRMDLEVSGLVEQPWL